MMIFNADMHPRALVQNNGSAMEFTCDVCGAKGTGTLVKPGRDKEPWGILPEDWSEIEDRRQNAKKPFVICCSAGECRHEAEKHSG